MEVKPHLRTISISWPPCYFDHTFTDPLSWFYSLFQLNNLTTLLLKTIFYWLSGDLITKVLRYISSQYFETSLCTQRPVYGRVSNLNPKTLNTMGVAYLLTQRCFRPYLSNEQFIFIPTDSKMIYDRKTTGCAPQTTSLISACFHVSLCHRLSFHCHRMNRLQNWWHFSISHK